MSDATITMKQATTYLTERGIKYKDDGDANHAALLLGWSLDNLTFQMHVIFDDDGKSVAIGSMLPLRVPKGKLLEALDIVNTLNDEYRWTRFYVDTDDNTIMVRIDAVVSPDTVGPVVLELVMRAASIVDRAFPRIAKAVF